jgi:hypothetical protein
MDPERLADLRMRLEYASDVIWSAATAEGIDIFVFVDELLADRDHHAARADAAEAELAELIAWASEMGCEMQADDEDDYDPRVCSPTHSGRCWPCEAKVRLSTEVSHD